MMDSRINDEGDRRAIWPGMCDISRHRSTGFVSSASPMRIKVGAVIVAAGMSQ